MSDATENDAAVSEPPVTDHWHYWPDEHSLIGCGYAERGEPCPLPHPVYTRVTPPGETDTHHARCTGQHEQIAGQVACVLSPGSTEEQA